MEAAARKARGNAAVLDRTFQKHAVKGVALFIEVALIALIGRGVIDRLMALAAPIVFSVKNFAPANMLSLSDDLFANEVPVIAGPHFPIKIDFPRKNFGESADQIGRYLGFHA